MEGYGEPCDVTSLSLSLSLTSQSGQACGLRSKEQETDFNSLVYKTPLP